MPFHSPPDAGGAKGTGAECAARDASWSSRRSKYSRLTNDLTGDRTARRTTPPDVGRCSLVEQRHHPRPARSGSGDLHGEAADGEPGRHRQVLEVGEPFELAVLLTAPGEVGGPQDRLVPRAVELADDVGER